MIIWIVLGIVTLLSVLCLFKKKGREDIISIYFGVPGAGKTTFAAWLVKNELKRGGKVWSNVPITGAMIYEPKVDLGKHSMIDGRIILDEASVEYNNRKFKELDSDTIKFLKYHRHYQTAIDVFSQSYDDMDITLRRLAQKYYLMKKSFLPWFVIRKTISKKIGIDENTKQIIDEYYFKPFSTKIIFCPPLWKIFNTISRDELPEKVWETW